MADQNDGLDLLLNAISSGSAVPAPSSSNRLSSAAPSDASRPPVTQSRPAAKAVGSSPPPDLPLNQVDLYPHHPSSFYPSHEGLSLDDANQEGTTLEEQHLALQELLEQYRAQPADVEGQEEDGELGEKERMGQVGVGRIPEEDGLLVLDASTSNGKRKADGPLPNPASYSYDHVRAELNAIVKDGFGSGRLTKLECSHPIAAQKSYGKEKRFITPSPLVSIALSPSPSPTLHSYLSLSTTLQPPLRTEQRKLVALSYDLDGWWRSSESFDGIYVGTPEGSKMKKAAGGGEDEEGEGEDAGVTKGKGLAGGGGEKVRSEFELVLEVREEVRDGDGRESSLKKEWERGSVVKRGKTAPAARPDPLHSAPFFAATSSSVHIRSKPPKRSKTGKHRAPSAVASLPASSKVFVHSRINKQTSRQGSLGISNGRLEILGGAWTEWRIERTPREGDDVGVGAVGGGAGSKGDWIWYGDRVSFVHLETGWRTEEVLVCRLEGKLVVWDEHPGHVFLDPTAPGFKMPTTGIRKEDFAPPRDGGTVGQLAKVVFLRPDQSQGRWYLSCSPTLGPGSAGPQGGNKVVGFVRLAEDSPGKDKADDFAIFTIGGVANFKLTHFELSTPPSSTFSPLPLPILIPSTTAIISGIGILEMRLRHLQDELYVNETCEIWIGGMGPLPASVVREFGEGELVVAVQLPEVHEVQTYLASLGFEDEGGGGGVEGPYGETGPETIDHDHQQRPSTSSTMLEPSNIEPPSLTHDSSSLEINNNKSADGQNQELIDPSLQPPDFSPHPPPPPDLPTTTPEGDQQGSTSLERTSMEGGTGGSAPLPVLTPGLGEGQVGHALPVLLVRKSRGDGVFSGAYVRVVSGGLVVDAP